jgi:hypothetical protein
LFIVFIDDGIGYNNNANLHTPTIGKKTVPGQLFAGDLSVSSFAIKGLHKAADQIVKYWGGWNLRCN